MNNFGIYTEIQLAKNLPELGFIKGDVATIVEVIKDLKGNYGFCLEFFDAQGNTLKVAVVDDNAIQKPILRGVVHYRELVL